MSGVVVVCRTVRAPSRVWRDFAESPEAVYRDGYKSIRKSWNAAL